MLQLLHGQRLLWHSAQCDVDASNDVGLPRPMFSAKSRESQEQPPVKFGKIPRSVTEKAQAKSVADQIHRLIESHRNQLETSHKFQPWNSSNMTQAFMLQSVQNVIWEFFQFILTAIFSGKSIDSLKHVAKKSLSRWLGFPIDSE
jgi:hypothetical protein